MPSVVFEHANPAIEQHAQHLKLGTGCLTVEISRSHTHTHTVGLLWTSDQLIAEVVTHTTQQRTKRTSMPSLVFKHADRAIEQQAQHLSLGTGRLTVAVSRSHTV